MSMRSRAQRTYKEMDAEYDDGFSWMCIKILLKIIVVVIK